MKMSYYRAQCIGIEVRLGSEDDITCYMSVAVEFDMRITPTVDLKELEAKILSWCKAAGEGVSVRFLQVGLRLCVGFSATEIFYCTSV